MDQFEVFGSTADAAKPAPNIYDIAAAAGVSTATVSRVLGGGKKVSEATRKKVLAVIQDLGYVPNAFARGLGLGSMRLVGVLCADVSDSFYARAVSLIERRLVKRDLNAILYCTGNELEAKKKGIDILLAKGVDAIVMAGSPFVELKDNSHITNAAKHVPVICVNGLVEAHNVYCVLCDDQQAMYDNAVRLLDDGCKNILYLYDAETYSGRQKQLGFCRAMREHGGDAAKDYMLCVERDINAVKSKVLEVLDQGVPVDGALASEDILAVGICKAAAARGLTLPVIGFNNSILAECATPALTSVDNMLEPMCNTAVDILNDVLNGKASPQKVIVSAKLVERETFKVKLNPPGNDKGAI